MVAARKQALRKSGPAAVLIRVDAQKRQRWKCPPYLYANDLLEKGTKRVKLVDGSRCSLTAGRDLSQCRCLTRALCCGREQMRASISATPCRNLFSRHWRSITEPTTAEKYSGDERSCLGFTEKLQGFS